MNKKEIIGCRVSSFVSEDGKKITGMNVWLGARVPSNEGDGYCSVERVYLSEKILMAYTPVCGDVVIIHYNKYGKVAKVETC